MPFELPLFPLNVVLFPGMQLPLHIFEPRYRLMIQRCLESDRTFGVALLIEGEEGQSGTLPASAGCSAEILEALPFSDDRINLQTVGMRRFRILSMREQDDYLIGTVEWLDDELPDSLVEERAQSAINSIKRYLVALSPNAQAAQSILDELDAPDDPFALSMWIAALVTLPNHQKQELLELVSTSRRLELEVELLHRAEIVHRAFARRVHDLKDQPPAEDVPGPFAQFLSPN